MRTKRERKVPGHVLRLINPEVSRGDKLSIDTKVVSQPPAAVTSPPEEVMNADINMGDILDAMDDDFPLDELEGLMSDMSIEEEIDDTVDAATIARAGGVEVRMAERGK